MHEESQNNLHPSSRTWTRKLQSVSSEPALNPPSPPTQTIPNTRHDNTNVFNTSKSVRNRANWISSSTKFKPCCRKTQESTTPRNSNQLKSEKIRHSWIVNYTNSSGSATTYRRWRNLQSKNNQNQKQLPRPPSKASVTAPQNPQPKTYLQGSKEAESVAEASIWRLHQHSAIAAERRIRRRDWASVGAKHGKRRLGGGHRCEVVTASVQWYPGV